MGVRVDILGPVRLFVDGSEVPIRRRQVERALVLLAAYAPAPVTQDQLIEHLWADSLPADPKASLRVALSRMRTTLGSASDSLRSETHGYVLDTASDCADFVTSTQLAGVADSDAEAAEHWAHAESLWGSLDSLSGAPLLEPLEARLRSLRTTSIPAHAECLHRLGRSEEAVAIAEAAHLLHRTDERLAMVAARSMAAVGRKAAAIELLTTTRVALRDELGLSPGTDFVEVEAAIVRGSPGPQTLDLARSVESAGIPFVGRAEELATLVQAGPGLHVVLGEPGAGKSALLDQLITTMVANGRTVLATQATQTPTRAMEPLADLLSQIAGAVAMQDHSDALRSSLSRLAPELVEGSVTQPASREGLLALTRESIEDFAAVVGDVVLVVDDAQWVDRSSTAVLNALIDGAQLPVVACSRVSIPAGLDFLLDEARHATTLRLNPLGQAEIQELVQLHLPSLPPGPTAESLLLQSGGNALFLSLLADLMAEGGLTSDGLPPNVLVAVQQRLSVLPADAQRTLEIASVFTGVFPMAVLNELAPTAESDIAAAVEQGLVLETDDPKQFKFAHTLVAEAAYQLLADGTRLELHDEVGRLLEAWGATAAEYSLHCGEAAQLDPTRAVRAHAFAAHEFASAFDWDTALLHAQRGLGYHQDYELAPSAMDAELQVIAGTALRAQGKPEGDLLLIDGVDLALQSGNTDTAVGGLLALCTHGRMSSPLGDTIYALLNQALAGGLTVAQRAQLLACEGTLVAISVQQERGRQAHGRAFEMLERSEDLEAKREVLMRTHLGFPHPADFASRVQATEILQQIAGNDPDILWEVAFLQFGSAMVQDDSATAEACLGDMRQLTPRIRMRQRNYGLRFSEAAWARYSNDLDRAEQLLAEAMEIGQESFDDGWTLAIYAAIMSSIRQAQGRLHELLPLADEWIRDNPDWPTWHVVAAAGAAEVGDRERARQELDWLMRDDFECLVPDISWGAMFSFLTGPVALLGDVGAAATLLNLLEPFGGMNLWNGACVHGAADDAIEVYRKVAVSGD